MKKIALWILSTVLALMMSSANAVKIKTLYQAHIEVSSQSAEERNQAVPKALAQVLIKVTGRQDIINDLKLSSLQGPAETLVQEFSYAKGPETDQNIGKYRLNVQFDPDGTNQLLRNANAPIWGEDRPLIVAWIAIDQPAGPTEMISSDSTQPLAIHLKQLAESRGLPFIFPMMDMTDLNQVSTDDISQMQAMDFIKATARYETPVFVMAHVTQSPNGASSEWRLFLNNEQWDWVLPVKPLDEMINTALDEISRALAHHYAIVTTNQVQKNVILKITAITQQNEFTQLVRYLEHLTPVADVAILQISDHEILLNVSLRSSQQDFMHTLALGQKLTPVPNSDGNLLAYQWGP